LLRTKDTEVGAAGWALVRPDYSHKSHDTQFQTVLYYLFKTSAARRPTLSASISLPYYLATTQKYRAHVQSAIGRLVSTNRCRCCCGWISALSLECSTPLPPPVTLGLGKTSLLLPLLEL